MRYFKLLSLLATTCLTACGAMTRSGSDLTSVYAIRDVAIVDVEKGRILRSQTVIVANDRIEKIGAQGTMDIPENAVIVNGDGLYLMSGLVDAHVHYFDAPVFGRLMLANGVLLVRDMGMPNEYILPLRDQLNNGETLGPEMVSTGMMLDGPVPVIPSIAVGVSTPEEGRLAVRRQAEAGVDMIKVYSKLDRDVFLAILDEAKKQDLKVAAHLPESVYIEDAADAGLGSSEHFNGFEKVIVKLLDEPVRLSYAGQGSEAHYLLRLDEVSPEKLHDVYRRIRESRMIVCPTVVTFKTLTRISDFQDGDFPNQEYISPSLADMWKQLWDQQQNLPEFIWQNWMQMVTGLNQAGVPLMTGTDLMLPGILPGYSVHEEMAIWQEAGIPPADILRSATIVPVQFMGLEDRLGTIEEGKIASMILVRGNPLEDVSNAQQIESVFLHGRYFSREALEQLLLEARHLASQPVSP